MVGSSALGLDVMVIKILSNLMDVHKTLII